VQVVILRPATKRPANIVERFFAAACKAAPITNIHELIRTDFLRPRGSFFFLKKKRKHQSESMHTCTLQSS
jgi:hypothetical protein